MVRNQANPTRLTARQRSRQNADLQEHLMSLPEGELNEPFERIVVSLSRFSRVEQESRRLD